MSILDRAVAAATAFATHDSKAEPSPPREVAPPREVEVHVAGIFITAGQLRAIGCKLPDDLPDAATCHGVLSLADAKTIDGQLVVPVSVTLPGHVDMMSVTVSVSA